MEITKIIGNPKRVNQTFEKLSFGRNRFISYFPTGIEKFAPNLNYLKIENSELLEIKQQDLKVFPRLKTLWMQGNLFETVEKDLFEFNPKLEAIDFSKNKIKEIDGDVFDNLYNLIVLDLNSNLCISMQAIGIEKVGMLIKRIKQNCQKIEQVEESKKEFNPRVKFWWWIAIGTTVGIVVIGMVIAIIRHVFNIHRN